MPCRNGSLIRQPHRHRVPEDDPSRARKEAGSGGEGFILQRLTGDGFAFVHAGGTIHRMELGTGQTIKLDTGCLVALQPSVHYDIAMTGGFKNTIFGGEGLFLATLTGPGTVWLQSLPFVRLADRILMNASQGRGKGEGSVLGGLANIFESRD